jgi:hypothetical protein
MMPDNIDTAVANERIGAMWLRLAEQIETAIPDIVIDNRPEDAMQWARCAEACFWQATGEAESHDVKDVLPSPPKAEG